MMLLNSKAEAWRFDNNHVILFCRNSFLKKFFQNLESGNPQIQTF